VYLVRLRSNQELVGLFVSPDEESLWDFVDECTDPFVCEYIELSNGGLYLSDAGAPRVPTVERYPTEEEKIPDWFAGATLSELWIDAFYTDRAAWKSIEFPDDLVT
jgi:hypothetical protein